MNKFKRLSVTVLLLLCPVYVFNIAFLRAEPPVQGSAVSKPKDFKAFQKKLTINSFLQRIDLVQNKDIIYKVNAPSRGGLSIFPTMPGFIGIDCGNGIFIDNHLNISFNFLAWLGLKNDEKLVVRAEKTEGILPYALSYTRSGTPLVHFLPLVPAVMSKPDNMRGSVDYSRQGKVHTFKATFPGTGIGSLGYNIQLTAAGALIQKDMEWELLDEEGLLPQMTLTKINEKTEVTAGKNSILSETTYGEVPNVFRAGTLSDMITLNESGAMVKMSFPYPTKESGEYQVNFNKEYSSIALQMKDENATSMNYIYTREIIKKGNLIEIVSTDSKNNKKVLATLTQGDAEVFIIFPGTNRSVAIIKDGMKVIINSKYGSSEFRSVFQITK